jgi:chemotaxis protein MotB
MARRHHHEEHTNHEAWAIPYGDLVTLLLAFFVVMYAISSVNEGKYRVMADALSSAFGGPPRTISPIELGNTQLRGSSFDRPSLQTAAAKTGPASVSPVSLVRVRQELDMPTYGRQPPAEAVARAEQALLARDRQLNSLGERIHLALSELLRQKLVAVRRGHNFLEVEIQSDILFASGVAEPSAMATSTVRKLAGVLREAPNAIRVEGYTDDRPIRTAQFPSNWELSSARAASVVHVLIAEGVDAGRLAVVGYGEQQPVADNATEAGRNANRRVLLVIMAAPEAPEAVPQPAPTVALERTPSPEPPRVAASRAAVPAPPRDVANAEAVEAAPSSVPAAGAMRLQGVLHSNERASITASKLAPQPGAG